MMKSIPVSHHNMLLNELSNIDWLRGLPTEKPLLSESQLNALQTKFSNQNTHTLAVAIREVLRFLALAAIKTDSLFFPGNQLLDEIWHKIILDTAEYVALCEALCAPSSLDHSGIQYEDYAALKTSNELHSEQLSWLCSYVDLFGDLDESAAKVLPLVEVLQDRYELDLKKLNCFARSLISEQEKIVPLAPDWNSVLRELQPLAAELDWNNQTVFRSISSILASARNEAEFQDTGLIQNPQLRELFKVSACLGFTIWQHLAAVERLDEATDWQTAHPETWNSIKQGKDTVGLGITHIAKAGAPTLVGTKSINGNYIVNGRIPWISGFGHFHHFVLGFAHHTDTVVAVVPLSTLKANSAFNRYKLACLNGTRTGSLDIVNMTVPIDSVLSCTPAGSPTRKTGSRYINPELGIAERALEIAESIIIKNGSNPRLSEAPATAISLRNKIADIDFLSSNIGSNPVQTCCQRDDLIHRCIRFLTFVEGGFALSAESMSSLLWPQVRLLDVFIQPQALIKLKFSNLRE